MISFLVDTKFKVSECNCASDSKTKIPKLTCTLAVNLKHSVLLAVFIFYPRISTQKAGRKLADWDNIFHCNAISVYRYIFIGACMIRKVLKPEFSYVQIFRSILDSFVALCNFSILASIDMTLGSETNLNSGRN